MNGEMLVLMAGGGLLVLYLLVRLWIAEHDRDLLMQGTVRVMQTDYSAGVGLLLALLIVAAAVGIGILWLIGAI